MRNRPLPIHRMASANPWPTSPSTFDSGTRTSSKCSEAILCSPIVRIGEDVQPRSLSTRKAVMPPRDFSAGSVTANTMAKSASWPRVMNVFSPFSTQSPPSRRALSLMAVASDPAPGSVSAKQETRSPSITGTRYSARCPGVPA